MLIIYDIKGVDKNEDIFFKYVLNIVKRERQKEKKTRNTCSDHLDIKLKSSTKCRKD